MNGEEHIKYELECLEDILVRLHPPSLDPIMEVSGRKGVFVISPSEGRGAESELSVEALFASAGTVARESI